MLECLDGSCILDVGQRSDSVLGLISGNFLFDILQLWSCRGSNEMMRYLFIVVFLIKINNSTENRLPFLHIFFLFTYLD